MTSSTITFSCLCVSLPCATILASLSCYCCAPATRYDLLSCIRTYWRRLGWRPTELVNVGRLASCFPDQVVFAQNASTSWLPCLMRIMVPFRFAPCQAKLVLFVKCKKKRWKEKHVWNGKKGGFFLYLIMKTETYLGILNESSWVLQTLLALLCKQ